METKKKVVVLNGSPKKERSSTMVVTNAFLKGLNVNNDLDIEIINVSDLKIIPCLGCLSCWGRTAGECVIKNDDVNAVKEKLDNADIVINSYPLYFFSMPGINKLLTDRLLSMMCTYEGQIAPRDGQSFHGIRNPRPNRKFIVISTCAYTETDLAYTSLLKQYDCICGQNNYLAILVPQMKTLVELNNQNKIDKFLEKFILAGQEFIENGSLSEETKVKLLKPPFTTSAYKVFLNNFWTNEREKGKK